MSNQDIDKFAAMEAMDENQIVDEIKGHVIEQYFYEFNQGNRVVTGLSYSGVKWVAQKLAAVGIVISITNKEFTYRADDVICDVEATELTTGRKTWGTSTCPQNMQLKDGTTKPDPFARQKALSKAQRNAIRNFIPEIAIQEGYKEWKNRDKQPSVNGGWHEVRPPK